MRQLRIAYRAWRANRPVRYRRPARTHWAVARRYASMADLVGVNRDGQIVCRSCLRPWDPGHQCPFPYDQ